MTRLTDNDSHLGPITYARSSWNPLRLVFSTGGGDGDGERFNHLTAYAFGWVARLRLPRLMEPWKKWVDTSRYEWSKNPNGGYLDVHPREYGFSLNEGFLQVFFGPQTGDSTTTKDWCKHLPWTQWHFHRHSYYGLNGELVREWIEPRNRKRNGKGIDRFQEQYDFKKTMPKVSFEIEDHDGQRIVATTAIEQRDYTFGEGAFQWLRFFRRSRSYRSLDIAFDAEVGPEKGSWKGGTVGHGIDMLPGELHGEAFARYCEIEHRSRSGRYKIKLIRRMEVMKP